MKKLLSPSDWLLLGLGGFLDIIQEMKDPFNLISDYYSAIHGSVPHRYRKTNFYHLVWRNIRTGNIEKKIIDGVVYLQVTREGRSKITGKFPLLTLQRQRWDRKWRIVIFDIEEEQRSIRDSFRLKLKELGFGQLQKSVWLTPFDFLQDFKEFIEAKELSDKVAFIETKNLIVDNPKDLAERVWKLNIINDQYERLYFKLNEWRDSTAKHLKKDNDRDKNLNELKNEAIRVLLKDPYLPKELLPPDWRGEQVKSLIKKLKIF